MTVLLSVAASQLIGCAPGPDPADLVKAMQAADTVEVKIQTTDGVRAPLNLTDSATINELSKLLKFSGVPQKRPKGTPGTLEYAYFRVSRKGMTDVTFTLLGTRTIFIGPGGQYEVRLESREFHDRVRGLSMIAEITKQWKAAKLLQIENSPENQGARKYEIGDRKTIEWLATLIDEKAEVKPSAGKLASANYVVIKILGKEESDRPVRQLTLRGKRCMFQQGQKDLFFDLRSDELYRRLRDQDLQEKESKPGQ